MVPLVPSRNTRTSQSSGTSYTGARVSNRIIPDNSKETGSTGLSMQNPYTEVSFDLSYTPDEGVAPLNLLIDPLVMRDSILQERKMDN